MKKETAEQKLMALLFGDNPELLAQAQEVKAKVENRKGKYVGVTDDEIEKFRAIEGLMYFLQAPELFSARVCKRCTTPFMVSRMHVAYCSYDCIRRSLNDMGLEWRKGDDLESLAVDRDVYEGNEPLWISNLSTLQNALEKVTSVLSSLKPKESPSSSPETLSEEKSTESISTPVTPNPPVLSRRRTVS